MRYVAFAFLAVGIAAPASADYGWCTIQKDGNYDTYISAVVDIGTGTNVFQEVLTRQFGRAFQGYVGQYETIVREPDCHSSKRLSDANESNRRYTQNVGQTIRTNWRGSWPSPSEETTPNSHSGSFLTVESKTPTLAAEPPRRKKSNAEADAEYAAAQVEYKRKLAEQAAEYKAAQDAVEQKKAEQRQIAQQAMAQYQEKLQVHDQLVRLQQLEYQKMASKPADAPNAVYRGFVGADCAAARLSATNGAGTSAGTRFKEVATDTSGGQCIVQGWWWDTTRTGSSRQ